MTMESIATIAYSATGIVSLFYIARQVALARNQAKGQFLLALDDRLEKSTKLILRLFNDQNFTPLGQEWGEVWLLMNTCERMNIMIEDRILDLDIDERTYGFRVALIQNDAIYTRILELGAECQDFINLCKKLEKRVFALQPSPSWLGLPGRGRRSRPLRALDVARASLWARPHDTLK
jgi:hypothetical protein